MPGIIRPARRPAGWSAPGPAPAGAQGRPELAPADDEDLCFLAGDWRLFQKQQGHRWSLDDLVTAYVATRGLDANAPLRALDLGCGLGSVLLMVAWKLPRAEVTGIEAQEDRAAMGRRSIAYNGADERCRIIDGDLRVTPLGGPFDLVTGTPPYFPRGTGTESDKAHAMACRFEARGGPEDYLAAAARLVAPTGRVVICSSILQRDRIASSALHHVEHWDIVPRAGKSPLLCVDVFALTPAATISHTIVVRDEAGVWTDAFRAIRAALGMPA